MKGIINKAEARRYALTIAKDTRHQPFTRVSAEFLDRLDAHIRRFIKIEIAEQPSKGRTIR